MDAAIWVAIITVGGGIITLIIQKIVKDRNAATNPGVAAPVTGGAAINKVSGGIDKPRPNETIARTYQCSGWAKNLEPGQHLWLAVEAGGFVWFKEGELHVNESGRWEINIFEDGATQAFSLSLFVADGSAQKLILDWFETGYASGGYPEIKVLKGTRRIARVDELRLR